jgi:diguanylate cyclase (GGDEF)-like protein
MPVELHAIDALAIALLVLAMAAQLVAAGTALLQMPRAGRYRAAWAMVSLALGLMVAGRLQPAMAILAGGPAHVWEALGALAVSLLLAVGLLGVRELFAEVQRQQDVLYLRATRDALTGLANRQHALHLGAREVERARRCSAPVAVLMVDIDHFKRVNDEHGHMVGDEALRAVASTLAAQLRAVDVLGRLGGEEFLVLLPGEDAARAGEVAERLRLAVERTSGPAARLAWPLTISIGQCVLRPDARLAAEDQLGAAMVEADGALYRAKHEGRNRVVAAAAGPESPLLVRQGSTR